MKTIFKTSSAVYDELLQRCFTQRLSDSRLLPGERALAAQLQTSRTTLRKALIKAEENGFLRRKNKQTEIVLLLSGLRKFRKIMFLTAGHGNEFSQPAFRRLWMTLKLQLDNIGAETELVLYEDNLSKDRIAELGDKKADLILLTVSNMSTCEAFKELQSKTPVIALDDFGVEFFDSYISLDNYAVGQIAAQTLLATGSRKPTFIYQNTNNKMFSKRIAGFTDFLKKANVQWKHYSSPATMQDHFAEVRRREVLTAVKDGCDSLFLLSDENIEFITHDLFIDGLVPDKVKLITLNGSGQCQICRPPIGCINHATEGVVQSILSHLVECDKKGEFIPIRKLVEPLVRPNSTLKKGYIKNHKHNKRLVAVENHCSQMALSSV